MHSHGGTTVVETDRDSSTGLIVGVIIALMIIFLVWLFAFSGWVGGNDADVERGPGVTNVEREGDTNVTVPGDTGTETDSNTGTDTQPTSP